mmetsp:Transcript_60462/g.157042  ORF Transcript_60462/g.157042 Transcript_60462/m.157042 type:complete len:282 (+) Transcript_60462:1422-2267(+)
MGTPRGENEGSGTNPLQPGAKSGNSPTVLACPTCRGERSTDPDSLPPLSAFSKLLRRALDSMVRMLSMAFTGFAFCAGMPFAQCGASSSESLRPPPSGTRTLGCELPGLAPEALPGGGPAAACRAAAADGRGRPLAETRRLRLLTSPEPKVWRPTGSGVNVVFSLPTSAAARAAFSATLAALVVPALMPCRFNIPARLSCCWTAALALPLVSAPRPATFPRAPACMPESERPSFCNCSTRAFSFSEDPLASTANFWALVLIWGSRSSISQAMSKICCNWAS